MPIPVHTVCTYTHNSWLYQASGAYMLIVTENKYTEQLGTDLEGGGKHFFSSIFFCKKWIKYIFKAIGAKELENIFDPFFTEKY